MTIETLKLDFIEQVMQIRSKETLLHLQEVLSSADLVQRTEESLKDIENGNVISVEEFSRQNKEWIKEKYT